MLAPVQVAQCVGCQVCAQECPTNAITIESSVQELTFARSGPVSYMPPDNGWQPLDAYTRAFAEEPGEQPWGEGHDWHVAERQETWQSWRTWLGERKEDLRAPCQAACPVGTNAGLYVSLVAQGRYDEAFKVASEPNPFPAICGRVCTAPCEDACRRGEFDVPIAIRDLKRFASDHTTQKTRKITPPKHWLAERVAIVGAGPTGLSAAYYLARRGYRVTVLDAMPVAGGMMAIGIPDYRLPREELNRDIEAMRELGVEIKLNTAIGRDIEFAALEKEYDAVLLAVGAQRSQRLGVPGEDAPDVTITRFPPISVGPIRVPVFGLDTVTATRTGGGSGSSTSGTGAMSMQIVLLFHHSLNIRFYPLDSTLSLLMHTGTHTSPGGALRASGSPMDAQGMITFAGVGVFSGGYLAREEASIVLAGQIAPHP